MFIYLYLVKLEIYIFGEANEQKLRIKNYFCSKYSPRL